MALNPFFLQGSQSEQRLVQNLIKFRGTKLPGGIELNGREIYDDAIREIDAIRQRMTLEFELPPLDFIG